MTSAKDMAEHPDVAEISDLTEGLLPSARSADVRRHLDACALCADVQASLEQIRDLLGTVPGPAPMPAEVAGRIDAALAAEALLHATAPGAAEENLVTASSSPGDDQPHVSRETSVPADRPAGHSHPSTTGPGRKGRLRAGRRRVAVLGTVFAVAALGLGSAVLSSLNNDTGSETGDRATAADTFSEDELEKQVTDLLARSQGQGHRKGSGSPQTFGLESESGGAAKLKVLKQPMVPECIREGIGRNDPALATEQGIYKGKQALLVVLPDTSDETRVTAYVVETTCVGSQPSATAAEILLKHSYTR
ncbi:anti-sigma factor family protein [Streptomyces sp. NPDC086080]|uniref:anti-sigma factor family protein n=1 Tax=Streptomyces sp. NPDC086080 TaxID=3365748 RepID=UPI0037D99081